MRAASVTNAALGVALGVRELHPELPDLRRRLAAQDGAPWNRPLDSDDVVEIDDLGDEGAVRVLASDLPGPLRRLCDWMLTFHTHHAGRVLRLLGELEDVAGENMQAELAEACGVDVPMIEPFYSSTLEPNYRLALVADDVSVLQMRDALVYFATFCHLNHVDSASRAGFDDEMDELLAALKLEPLLDGAVSATAAELAQRLKDFAAVVPAALAAAKTLFQGRGYERRNDTECSRNLLPELRPAARIRVRIDARKAVEWRVGRVSFAA